MPAGGSRFTTTRRSGGAARDADAGQRSPTPGFPAATRASFQRVMLPVSEPRFVLDAKILSRPTANAVLKQAGLPKSF
jgi:hypothetical protein